MTRAARPVLEILPSVLGLAVWAAHFGAIYALHALSCERDLSPLRPFGLPFVPVGVAAATLVALAALALVLRLALRDLGPPLDEGGEEEPRFTRWFAAATAGLAVLAVVFQTLPAFVMPACG